MPTACDEGGFNIDLWAEFGRRSSRSDWPAHWEGAWLRGIRVEQWKVFLNVKGHTPGRLFNRTRHTSSLLAVDTSVTYVIARFLDKLIDTARQLSYVTKSRFAK